MDMLRLLGLGLCLYVLVLGPSVQADSGLGKSAPTRNIPMADADEAPAPAWVNELLTTAEVVTHSRQARDWLEHHPHHDSSLYVAERLYLAARLQPDVELWDWLREYIEANHHRSIFADFVATDYLTGTVDGVNRALAGYLERRLFPREASAESIGTPPVPGGSPRFEKETLTPVLQVVSAAARRQPALLAGLPDDMVYRLNLALTIVPHQPLTGALRPRIEKLSAEGREIIAILSHSETSATERLFALERLRIPATKSAVSLYQEYLWQGLTEAELETAEVVAIDAERQVEGQKFAAALKSLTRLQEIRPTTRTGYLLGWSLQHLGRFDEANEQYRSVAGSQVRDPWQKLATEAVEYSVNQSQRRSEYALALHRFLEQYRQEPARNFYIRYRSNEENGAGLRLFAFVDDRQGRMLTVVSQGNQLTLAGEGSTAENWLLFGGESIRVAQKAGGSFPRFNVNIPANPKAGTEWRFNFNSCPDPFQFGRDIRESLRQPSINKADALANTVSRFVGAGFVQRISNTEEETTWGCHIPNVRTAEWRTHRWTISRNAETLRWEQDDFQLEIGQADEPDFPEWQAVKDLPSRTSLPGTEGREVRSFGLVMSLFSEFISRASAPEATALVEGEPLRR